MSRSQHAARKGCGVAAPGSSSRSAPCPCSWAGPRAAPPQPSGDPSWWGSCLRSSSSLITPHPEAVAPQHLSPLRTEQGARQGLARSLPGCVCRRRWARAGAGPVLQHLCLPRAARGCCRFTSFMASSIPLCHSTPRGEPGWPSCSRRGSGTALHCSADSHGCSHSPPRPASCVQHFELGTHINQVNKRSALSACLGTFSSSLRSALVRLHHP